MNIGILAQESAASLWVLGSFIVVCFGAIISLYSWIGGKMDKQESKFVTKEMCQQAQKTQQVTLDYLKDGQDKMCKKVDKLVSYLIGETNEEKG